MIDAPKELLPFIADYKLNLISPQIISDEDFTTQKHQGKFSTGFGTLMQVIKHQNEMNVVDIIKSAPNVDSDSADMIEEFSNFKFDRDPEKKGVIDMCKGMELYTLKTQVEGAIQILKSMNVSDDTIIENVAKEFNVTTDYVKKLMIPEAV